MRYVLLAWIVVFFISSTDLASAAEFELSIKLDSDQIVEGEPLFATITAKNTSGMATRFAMKGAEYHLEFYLEHRDEGFRRIHLKPFMTSSGPGTLMQPDEALSTTVLLAFKYEMRDGRQESSSVFNRAGPYQLKWSKLYDLRHVMSNTVSVNVIRGNAEDIQARNIYTHRKVAEWLELRNDDADHQVENLLWLIKQNRTSVFVDHAHMRLAEYFDTKSPRNMNANMAWDDDNVWLVPEVKAWTVARVLHHYTAVSERNPSLRARAVYAAGAFAVAHSRWVPEGFDIDKLLAELEKHSQFADQLALPHSNAETIRSQLRKLQQAAPK